MRATNVLGNGDAASTACWSGRDGTVSRLAATGGLSTQNCSQADRTVPPATAPPDGCVATVGG